jgi:hypothetical protein
MNKKWLSKTELIEYSGFSMGKIQLMMSKGEIKYSKVGKRVIFDIEEVDNLFKSLTRN